MAEETAGFQYDVAFSFLDRDNELALELAKLLSHLPTFVYSQRQREVAGTDGVETFSGVFRRGARTVAILYREGWAQTKWTRIESEAIKSRFLEDGPEFVILVKLDSSPAPVWFPTTRIWVDFTSYGAAGAASAIQERVRIAGGTIRAETPQENAARLVRERRAAAERHAFLSSDAGVKAAEIAVERLFERLETLCREIGVQFVRDRQVVQLYMEGFSLNVLWSRTYTNTLNLSELSLTEWQGRPDVSGHRFHRSSPPRELLTQKLQFDIDEEKTLLWREERKPRRKFMVDGLADECLNRLIARVRDDTCKS